MSYLDDGELIDLVKRYTNIWNKTDPKYANPIEVDNSWIAIANILNFDVEDCKSRWNLSRQRYAKEIRQMRRNPPDAEPYQITWPYYNRCMFLSSVIKPRRSRKDLKWSVRNPEHLNQQQIYSSCLPVEAKLEQDEVPESTEEVTFDESLSSTYFENNTTTSSTSRVSTPTSGENRQKKDDMSKMSIDTRPCACPNVTEYLRSSHSATAVPKGINPEDWHCVLSIGMSLSQIKSLRKKMSLKAKLMSILAEEGDWSE